MSEISSTYHEVDVLIPAQKYTFTFSYITYQGLPFYRDFVLRLVRLAPMKKSHIMSFFGLTLKETDEAISDLVARDELTISSQDRLVLTSKSEGYFSGYGEPPKNIDVLNCTSRLIFDLISGSCHGVGSSKGEHRRASLEVKVAIEIQSASQRYAGDAFQDQFQRILKSGWFPNSLKPQQGREPRLYALKSVKKLGNIPVRLPTSFKIDQYGNSLERDDYQDLISSSKVHEAVSEQLAELQRLDNFKEIQSAMEIFSDDVSPQLFSRDDDRLVPSNLDDVNRLEENTDSGRSSFLGPLYTVENISKFSKYLSQSLAPRVKSKKSYEDRFIWIAPSDNFWGKSDRFLALLSDFVSRSEVGSKQNEQGRFIYRPTLYLPIGGKGDKKSIRRWSSEIGDHISMARGIIEGFMQGNIEIMHFESELAVVIYHLSDPERLPVSMPFGFITRDIETVNHIGCIAHDYIQGVNSYDLNNDLGQLEELRG